MIGFDWKRLLYLFLAVWAGVNLVQAIFTEVMSDEAYYFLYGENLAWGYFDHPPMVGLMTFLSNLFWGGNLSVRFVTVVLQSFTLLLIWKTIADKRPEIGRVVLFFVIAASLVMFQVYGFVTTPDAPFLFFTALFLFSYKKFLRNESLLHTFLLAVAMAGMIYSKYHGVLIIGFVLLSNLRLLSRYKFWLAGLLAVGLLLPHIYWQAANDFPSFKYHLSDRNSRFRWNYLLEYLPNQLAVFNPFTFGAVVYILLKYKPRDVFERGLYFLIAGVVLFFWAMSFRGHVEPHWTVACSIPMLVLLYRRSLENPRLLRYVKKAIAPSLFLLLFARILLLAGLLPEKLGFSGKRVKNEIICSVVGDVPVVFTGSFQGPSNYHFFTGKESFVLSAIGGRQTQFDLWEKELAHQGKQVFIYSGKNNSPFDGYFAENFQSVNRIRIDFTLTETEVRAGDTIRVPFRMQNPTAVAVDFHHPAFPVNCRAAYQVDERRGALTLADCVPDTPLGILPAKETAEGFFTAIVPDLAPGNYLFSLSLVNSICAARNSDPAGLKIQKR
jgi:4-amino-4-deoxy-L-arabinose transferase-like glycosyltransferase